jgi:hypothetical protein
MNRQLLLAAVLALACVAPHARGQAESKPAADSPRAALMAQDAAAKSGNVEADLEFYQAGQEQEKKLARAIAQGDVAVAKLQKAVADRFGKSLAAAAVRAAGTEDAEAIESATESVDGDHATIHFADSPTPVPMIRNDGKWKVSLPEWTRGASPGDLDQLTSRLSELADHINHITELVSQDKFRSGEGVRDRVQELHDRLFGAKR